MEIDQDINNTPLEGTFPEDNSTSEVEDNVQETNVEEEEDECRVCRGPAEEG